MKLLYVYRIENGAMGQKLFDESDITVAEAVEMVEESGGNKIATEIAGTKVGMEVYEFEAVDKKFIKFLREEGLFYDNMERDIYFIEED